MKFLMPMNALSLFLRPLYIVLLGEILIGIGLHALVEFFKGGFGLIFLLKSDWLMFIYLAYDWLKRIHEDVEITIQLQA